MRNGGSADCFLRMVYVQAKRRISYDYGFHKDFDNGSFPSLLQRCETVQYGAVRIC